MKCPRCDSSDTGEWITVNGKRRFCRVCGNGWIP